jgi:hypothetical protein
MGKLEACISDGAQDEDSSGNRPFELHACHEAGRDDDYHEYSTTLNTTNHVQINLFLELIQHLSIERRERSRGRARKERKGRSGGDEMWMTSAADLVRKFPRHESRDAQLGQAGLTHVNRNNPDPHIGTALFGR